MAKVTIYSVGKTKEPWLVEGCAEYQKRLTPWLSIETVWAKDDARLIHLVSSEKNLIALDPQGKLLTSEQFAEDTERMLAAGGAHLAFVIGGPEGLPPVIKSSSRLISFSPMTFTHQMCRLILMEQLYRAFTIINGKSYHK